MSKIPLKYIGFVAIALLILWTTQADAQACSCGGAPLLGALEFPTTPKGQWQVGLTYEHRSIGDVVSETEELDDDTRRRTVNAGLLEVSYGLGRRISVSALLTTLQQRRTSSSSFGTGEELTTSGIGDGIVMVKYSLYPYSIYSHREISVGLGVKAPLGASDLRSNGSLIAADMQPGTGAWDGIAWAYIFQDAYRSLPLSFQVSTSYRYTGTNDRFGTGGAGYKLGNEFVGSFGVTAKAGSRVDTILGFRIRFSSPDQLDSVELPNTGGSWLDVEPGLVLRLTDSLALSSSLRVPMYRELNGTQLSTSISTSASLFYTFQRKRTPTIEF